MEREAVKLADDELRELSGLARGGDIEARNRIVEANLGLVGCIVARLRRRSHRAALMSREDLMQEGSIGLIDAAEKWDAGLGCPFATYAGRTIEMAVRDAARCPGPVRLPYVTHSLSARWQRLAAGGMDEPEIIRKLGLTPARVERVKAALALDSARVHGAIEEWDGDLAVRPEDRPSEAEDWLHEGLSRLDPWDREALVLRYGLGGTGPLACREIGRRLGVSGQAVLNAVQRASGRLAAALAG